MGKPLVRTPRATITDYAWCAGFIDGDGCFYARPNKKYKEKIFYRVELNITQVELKPLLKIQRILGGRIYGPYTKTTGSPTYQYRLGNYHLRYHINSLWPYLTNIKRARYNQAVARVKQSLV